MIGLSNTWIVKLGFIIVLIYLFFLGFTHIATALNKTIVYWTLLLLFGGFLLTFWEAI